MIRKQTPVLVCAVMMAMVDAPLHAGNDSFVNWESPQVNPIDLTPGGGRLLVVNTADNRLEVFDVVGDDPQLVRAGSVAVGLDPVSVRARTDGEAWVVNHISDSISVIDLNQMVVTATINTGDEPTDVVFAGDPQRAFVSISQLNRIDVYDPADVTAAPVVVPIEGEDPRALATDGSRVFAAIFQSGNDTTILSVERVSSAFFNPYSGDANPPPNAGGGFDPPMTGGNPTPPESGLIVKKDEGGQWWDDNTGNWTPAVEWDLHGHDVAVIEAGSLAVTYVSGLMNANMHLSVGPAGQVMVVGTDATNEIRFEPNLNGRFLRVVGATFAAENGGGVAVTDLNPHLDYTAPTVDQSLRDQSIGDPRGVAWNGTGDLAFITGMGSNNVIAVDAGTSRVGLVEVGVGPTGIRFDAVRDALYVLNRFEGSVSVIDSPSLSESSRTPFFDPTPSIIREGRPHLYDTHKTSGLGQASCGSCHIDGRMDQLGWDLGDPAGAVKPFNQTCNFGLGGCEDWHPMKGPMTTQTLMGIVGTEPLHWRADREDLAAFNGAFEGLMGDDTQLTDEEMDQFNDFIATLTVPPNPYRNLDGSPATALSNGGNASTGASFFVTALVDGGLATCASCHALPTGTNGQLTSANLIQEPQSMKIAQLRNMHEKTGFDEDSQNNNRGFGYTHDGAVDSLLDFLDFPGFVFAGGAAGDQQRLDLEAFLLSFATDTHAGVGAQATMGAAGGDQTARRDELLTIADTGAVDLVVKGTVDGAQRGYLYTGGGQFQSDRALESSSIAELDGAADQGAVLTYTLVPEGTGTRIGIDRDEDGALDRDELDACANPADSGSTPDDSGLDPECCLAVCAADAFCCDLGWDGQCVALAKTTCGSSCAADVNGDGAIDVTDLVAVITAWGTSEPGPDVNGDGVVDVLDLVEVIVGWGACT